MARRVSLVVALALGGTVLLAPAATAGGGCLPDPARELSSSSKTVVAIDNCAFVDTVTFVEPGAEVRWVNRDHAPHTVTGVAQSWGTEDIVDLGDEISYAFEKEGVYPYYCALHPAMVGTVVVGDGRGPATGAAGVTLSDHEVARSSEAAPVETSGDGSPVTVALAITAGLAAAIVAGRFALARRAGAASAS